MKNSLLAQFVLAVLAAALLPLTAKADVGVQERLAFIESRLQSEEQHRDIWQWGWAGVYGASGVANAYQWVEAENKDERWNFGVGTARSGLALYQQLASPYPSYDDYLASVSAGNDLDKNHNEKLLIAEKALKARAERDAARFTWRPHLENVAANLIAGGLIAGFGDKNDGLAAFASGVISGELAIWTQPNRGEEDWADYQNFVGGKTAAVKSASAIRWLITPQQVMASWRF